MKVDMLMPQMGESIAEATISKWLKAAGEQVKKDEIILEISTDKVDSEIPAPATGVISELLFSEGDVVPVKEKIAIIDTDAAGSSPVEPAATTTAPAASAEPAPQTTVVETVSSNGHNSTASQVATPQNTAPKVTEASDKFYSPLVRGLAEKHGVSISELDNLAGTGQGGRFTKQDFMQYLESRGNVGTQPAPAAGVAAPQSAPAPQLQPVAPPSQPAPPQKIDMPGSEWREDNTKVVPMDNMRKAIAAHMVRSKQTSPHVYSIQEVDMTAVSRWRNANKAEFKSKEGFNLSFTPFFLEAAVKGLIEFPYINASVEGNAVILKKNVGLGCAVALGTSGLIVPVIKNAEERNLVGLARTLNDLALRARNKKLMPDDVMGGTFTVTNPGVFGTMIGTPIINQPQVAILCLGAIEKRPVVVDDMIAIRERCYLTLSYDHRIVDGSMGGQYLAFLKKYLESWNPERSLY